MTEAPRKTPSKLRADIQALRGLAVLVVVLFHAKVAHLDGGYLGVDIFFVISGFLMTSQIRDGLTARTFTLPNFYLRRAKRLLPAAYAVFLLTVLLAPLFLARLEMREFVQQLLGAVTFSSNVVLWRQSGYFDGMGDLKPLLHTWSLSLEEQYYLVLPAAMMLVPARRWSVVAAATCLGSFALVVAFSASHIASFYLLPTRAWELMIGSIAALAVLPAAAQRVVQALFGPALAALLVLPFLPWRHGGIDLSAVVVCAATYCVIVARHPLLSGGALVTAMGKLGDISYSLYLLHWPAMAYFSNAWFGDDEAVAVRMLLALGTVVAAVGLHRWVEKPLQHATIANVPRFWAVTASVPVALLALAYALAHLSAPAKDYATLRRPNVGLDAQCDFHTPFSPLPACRTADKPKVLVWGDSHAMHLLPGMVATLPPSTGVVQATRSTCAPLLGIAAVSDEYPVPIALQCVAFNESVAQYLARTPSIEVVVLASTLGHYVDAGWQTLRVGPDGQQTVAKADLATALAGFAATVKRVRALGKRVVVAASPPQQMRDTGRCLERMETGLPLYGSANCQLEVSVYHAYRRNVLALLAQVPPVADVEVVSMDPYLCDAQRCRTVQDGVALYRDAGHLSYAGSVAVFGKARLADAYLARAR